MAHLTNKAYGYPTRGARRRVKVRSSPASTSPATAAPPRTPTATRPRATSAPTRTEPARMDRRPTTTSPATAGRSRPSTRRGTPPGRTATSRARTPRTPGSPRCSPCAPRATTPTRRTGLSRVRRLRLGVPDHQGPAAVLRGPDRRDGQGDEAAGKPRHGSWPQRPQQRQPGILPLFQGKPRGVPRRHHRPGERDPAAADHDDHHQGRRHAPRSPPRIG